jgi:molybdopterin converting factor small subunit
MPDVDTVEQSADLAVPAGTVAVRVWLFGWLSRMVGERETSFALPSGAMLADVLAALGRRYGDRMLEELMRTRKHKSSACRISLNGRLVHDLDVPLGDGAATVEIIVLSAHEGG